MNPPHPSPDPHAEEPPIGGARLLWLGVAVSATMVHHFGWRASLDLHDHEGPAGVILLQDLLRGGAEAGRLGPLLSPIAALFGAERVAAWVPDLATLASLVGVALFASALSGRGKPALRAGALATLLMGCWAPAVFQGLMEGPDGLAMGLAGLGLGLCAWNRTSTRFVGAFLLVLGGGLKASALTHLAFLPVALFFDRSRPDIRSLVGLVLGGGLGLSLVWGLPSAIPLLAGAPPPDLSPEALSLPGIPGLSALFDLPRRGLPQGAFGLLFGGAVLSLLPTPGRWRRLAVVLSAVVLAEWLGRELGGGLVPRYLLALGPPLLANIAAGLCSLTSRPTRIVGMMIAATLLLGFALDNAAHLQAWDRMRARLHAEAPPRTLSDLLPTRPRMRRNEAATSEAKPSHLPPFFEERYQNLSRVVLVDALHPGAPLLARLAEQAPAGGAACPALRDRREAHGGIAASLAGKPWVGLDPAVCCVEGKPSPGCAREVTRALCAAGARLILPTSIEGLNDEDLAWLRALAEAAPTSGLRLRERTAHFWAWDPIDETGKVAAGAGPLPCPPPPTRR